MQCPLCKGKLNKEKDQNDNYVYRCIQNHSFDISKYSYVNLLVSKTNSGDNKEMIQNRHNFLEKDYFLDLALKLKKIINSLNIKLILDCGCGEGYFDRIINKENNIKIIGLDISKEAVKMAAKKDKSIDYVVASSYNIPFVDKYFDAYLSIFAPIDSKEAKRVSKSYLIKVIPNKMHLMELKEKLYDDIRETSILKEEIDGFSLYEEYKLKYKKYVEDVNELFKMTPYYYTTHNNFDIHLESSEITFDFIIRIYKCL